MAKQDEVFSLDKKRNLAYCCFLKNCYHNSVPVKNLVELGCKLMKKAGLHPHFLKDNTLYANALILAEFVTGEKSLEGSLSFLEAKKIIACYEKRISQRLPVEYIIGEAEYLGRRFYVNENVLVPRSLMSTRFEDFLKKTDWETHRVLDLCTGSGCIGITLALMLPKLFVDLADISPTALQVANRNIDKFELNDHVKTIESNVFENIEQKYDLIISNPPYVSRKEYHCAPEEFKNEPHIALESGQDGLDLIRQILAQAKSYLNPKGQLVVELGTMAAKRLKKQTKSLDLNWYPYRKPDGSVAFLAQDCIFSIQANALS